MISERRNGNAKLRTDYAYNLRSWVTGINGALFSQTLRYQEDIAGNILGLLRYGQTGASSYGLVDNLNLFYNGNRLQSVYDNATNSVYGNGMEFVNGANAEIEYEYDENGNLTKDLNKNVLNIEYNCLDLPCKVTFEDGNTIEYVYAADGTKLQTVHKIDGETTTRDYCGNAVYENGELKMLLNDYGYVSFPDRKFHFYLKDHQGNVRVVADAEGNVEEVNDYYPFGGLMSNATTNEFQPYKYNGKELDRKAGLNLYDYGARFYDPAIGRFGTVDPMSEKLYQWNPYAYCLDNPVKLVDENGELPVFVVPLLKGLAGGIIDFGVQMSLNMASGTSFTQALKNVDWTSVGASTVGSAVGAIGSSTAIKAAKSAIVTSDALVDYSKERRIEYSTLLGGNKSIAKSITDAAASTLPEMGGDKLIKEFDKAISSDLSSKGAATLTKETKAVMRDAQQLVNSEKFKMGAEALESVVGGTAGKGINDQLDEFEKLKKMEELQRNNQ